MDDIRKVVQFDSVEEFWGTYNNIVPPSQLPGKANYYLFKVSRPNRPQLTDRTTSCLLGKTRRTRMEVNGPFRSPETRPRAPLTGCGSTPYVFVPRIFANSRCLLLSERHLKLRWRKREKKPRPRCSLISSQVSSVQPVQDCMSIYNTQQLTSSYRLAIWTREAPDVTLSEENELMRRMMTIGRHFKVSVLGYELDQKLVTGGFQTEVSFQPRRAILTPRSHSNPMSTERRRETSSSSQSNLVKRLLDPLSPKSLRGCIQTTRRYASCMCR